MLNDDYRQPSRTPVPGPGRIPAQRTGVRAPLTLGRPAWQRRYTHAALAVVAGAVGCAPVLYLVWKGLVHQPLAAAALSVLAISLVGRTVLFARLRHLRRRGRAMSTVLAVGTIEDAAELIDATRRRPALGWRVVGVCTPTGAGPGGLRTISGVPVLGDLDSVATEALASYADAVAVAPAPGWTAVRLRQLAADLDCSHTALLVDPRLVTDDGVRTAPVRGLPLQRLAVPTLTGARRVLKGAGDRLLALVLLVVMAPFLAACALAVRRDGGPAFDRHPRLGRNGRPFAMLAFRTTDVGTGTTTAVGRALRERCLDGLPQLFNVLGGAMAVVGPRPAVPSATAQRGLLVKPGITGLSSMRATDLPVDGLDRHYLEEWSPALDARILLRAVRTVIAGAAR